MSGELNKAIVSRFYEELWNNRNLKVADEIFAADCITHQLQSGAASAGVPRSAEAVKHHVAEWLEGFPDLRFSVEQMLAAADHVVSRSVMHGTHTGIWQGIAPTGKPVSIRMFVDHRIISGKIVEDWVLVDALGFFQQLEIVASTQEILIQAAR
jgi:predicted ester cyclase